MENQLEKKWYQKPTAVVLFLIFFFPVGLILMWKHNVWSKTARWIVTGVFALAIIANANKNLNGNDIYSGTWSSLYAEGNLHSNYSHSITIELKSDGSLTTYENDTSGSNINSCESEGYYTVSNDKLIVSGVNNSNCPWMSKVNGTYYRNDNSKYYVLKNNNLKVLKNK